MKDVIVYYGRPISDYTKEELVEIVVRLERQLQSTNWHAAAAIRTLAGARASR